MQLVRGLQNLQPQHRGCVATIGNFDGVHRGHQAILARLCERARELGVPSCVVIFEPQPREFFGPDTAPPRLMRLRDKLALFAAAGVDRVLCLSFNRRLRELSAAEFVQTVLLQGLGVQHLEVGDDFRFGCDRAGDFAFLQTAAEVEGFTLEAASTVEIDGLIAVEETLIEVQLVDQTGASAGLNGDAQAQVVAVLLVQQTLHLVGG
ncbi:MAG: hypothetical protein AAGC84_07105, partial [Pseudomonas sp.]